MSAMGGCWAAAASEASPQADSPCGSSCASCASTAEPEEPPDLPPLPRLLARGEAFHLCAFLDATDVSQLACTSAVVSSGYGRDGIWRALFVLRWGSEQGVSQSTEIRIIRSWGDEPWPEPRFLAAGFCGARSSLDHLFWFLPMMRILLRIDKVTAARPVPLPPSLTWQVVCRVRTQNHGETRMARCLLCDVMEVAPPGPAPQHFRQRWARPCASCPHLAHRACLEHLLGGCLGCDTCANGKSSAGCKGQAVGAAASAALRCGSCGEEYHVTNRFPETFLELLFASMLEWKWVLRRVFVVLVFLFWLHSMADHYSMLEGFSRETRIVMIMTSGMMSITVSQRFHLGVKKIWHTKHRLVYFKLFLGFAVLAYFAVLRVFEPGCWQNTVAELPWLTSLHRAHKFVYNSIIGTIALSTVSWLYIFAGSGLCFCFWKTSLRVPTVADVGHGHDELLKRSCSRCGLCQLGICLDNTAM